jgi:hypothetical protein
MLLLLLGADLLVARTTVPTDAITTTVLATDLAADPATPPITWLAM